MGNSSKGNRQRDRGQGVRARASSSPPLRGKWGAGVDQQVDKWAPRVPSHAAERCLSLGGSLPRRLSEVQGDQARREGHPDSLYHLADPTDLGW